ncbi:MAG: hypothetical protein M1817_004606 [Caeruleum heppii]|nr:MAG: hypothetical protein M1817_004606 [Caeruleum heppii]
MAGLLNNLFGGQRSTGKPGSSAADDDFADFADAPSPSPAPISPIIPTPAGGPAFPTASGLAVPYTKWYRVWERTSPKDFVQEAFVIPFVILAVLIHLWGTRKNRRIANRWFSAHGPLLEQEYAVVGFGGRRLPSPDEVESTGLAQAMTNDSLDLPDEMLREKTAQQYITYATGRLNVAFSDVTLSLYKRYNPLALIGEFAVGFLFESFGMPQERIEVVTYPFDGKEAQVVPIGGGKQGQELLEQRKSNSQSSYDGFVWAVVNKDRMKRLRDERYDISLTTTKDHPKLPIWATVMTESAELTELLLTKEMIAAVEAAGELLDYMIVTDQPLTRPSKLEEAVPKKRLQLSIRLPSESAETDPTLPLFTYFLRLPDQLASSAHFRPEVMRRVRQTREEQIRKLQRVDETEKLEERNLKRDKEKKEKRDAKLKGLTAEEQRKYLDKEREKEMKKSQKRMTQRA